MQCGKIVEYIFGFLVVLIKLVDFRDVITRINYHYTEFIDINF